MKNLINDLSPIPGVIFHTLEKSKDHIVYDKNMVLEVYGNTTNLSFQIRSIQKHISSAVKPFANSLGLEITRIRHSGYKMSGKLPFEKGVTPIKHEFFYMYDYIEGKDYYDTPANFAEKLNITVHTVKRACLRKKWCKNRYFFRLKEDDPLSPLKKIAVHSKNMKAVEELNSYERKFKELKQKQKNSTNFIQLDSKTRVRFRKK